MTSTPSRPRQKLQLGAVVRCRTCRYLVEDVQATQEPGTDTVVSMARMEDDAIGQRLTVFREGEIDFEVLGESSCEAVAQRGFDQPRQFSSYLNTLRWNCVTATDAELFQAPYRAGIDVKAYQLEPLRKALQMPRVGLFIADDVGLGKTIEEGLNLREMLLRQRIKRVVISCPPSVLRQWQEEMASPFGLVFTVMDRAYLAKVRQERGYGTNPWSTHSRFHDSAETSSGLLELRRLHGEMDQAVLAAYGWSSVPTACGFGLDYLDTEDDAHLPGAMQERIDSGELFFWEADGPLASQAQLCAHGAVKPTKKLPWRYRWSESVRDDVLAHLLAVNAERYAEEVAQGLHGKGSKKPAGPATPGGKRRGRPPKAARAGENGSLPAEQMGLGF